MMPGSVFGATPYGAPHLVCALLCVIGVSSEMSYISTVGKGVVSAEDGNASFSCHMSEPDVDATVETGRYVYTLNYIVRNPDPPDPTETMQGNPPSVVYKTNLPENNDAYGVFYCASSYDEGWTLVPMIFLRSDAKFHPAGGRFTKTVNAMDSGVTVEFNRISSDGDKSNWRHNGTLSAADTIAVNYDISYTIPQDVQPSDGGVYELHYGNQRQQARGGLMRLIVRECPAGRHDSSHTSQCIQTCPSCYNGGICDDKTGQCICPPGFQGENCETGCGRNSFGRNCEYRCDYDDDIAAACQGFQMCVPDPYGCSCAPGYKGLDCLTRCDTGEFGASCTETCHCESGECNRFTGICTETPTTCMSGWEGENCQRCVRGKHGSNCTGNLITTYSKTNEGIMPKVNCMFEGEQLYSTAVPVVSLHRKYSTGDFNQDGIMLVDVSANGYTYNISRTQVGEVFYCSMSDVNTFNSAETIGDGTYDLIQLQSPPDIVGTTNETVMLTWAAWDVNLGVGDQPLIGYDVLYKNDTPNSEFEQMHSRSLEPTRTITGLSPDTDYVFVVRAVRPGEGGEGPTLDVSGKTSCSPPEGPTSVAIMNSTTPGEISVTVQIPDNGSNCKAGYTGVRIYHIKLDDTSSIQKRAAPPFTDFLIVSSGMYDVTSLELSSSYAISVALLNRGSESDRSDEFIVATAEINTPGGNGGQVGGVVGGIVVLIIIVVFVIGIILFRRRKRGTGAPIKMAPDYDMDGTTASNIRLNHHNGHTVDVTNERPTAYENFTPAVSVTHPPMADSNEKQADIYENYDNAGAVTSSTSIAAEELESYIASKKADTTSGFDQDFQLLPDYINKSPQTVGSREQNKTKNRFKNILPYDHSRVVLPPVNGKPFTDYYNASYIRDHRGNVEFVASQAPNTASIDDFWRVIWQENVRSIVMLTNLIEKGKDRCTEYWPTSTEEARYFGKIELKLRSVAEYSDHVHRVVDVRQVEGEETRTIHQFHYRAWPDMGVPQYPTTLISFVQEVKGIYRNCTSTTRDHTHMLVHCSAGVGRTGSFISLYCLIDQMEAERRVDIIGFISTMRESRPNMIQTKVQYVFVHTALLEAYLSRNTVIPTGEFESRKASILNQRNLDKEFKVLDRLTPPPGKEQFEGALRTVNRDKNRYGNILPRNGNRPCLLSKGEAGSTDYINASFLHTYTKKDVFVVTQMPLPNTRGDIWRLAFDWKCPIIVMLNDMDASDKSCAQYWPEKGSVQYGALDVSLVSSKTNRKDYTERDFKVQSKGEEWVVKQFQFLNWPNHKDAPDSISSLSDLLEAVRTAMKKTEQGPIIIHCMNGIGRSGVFATVYAATEKIFSAGVIDVFQSVKRLRALRPGMIENVQQYRTCYEMIGEYLKQFDEYANV